MTARDLQQRRNTDSVSGDTTWELSGLLDAAKTGKVALLEGLEQLPLGALSVLHPLLVDGSTTLHDGSVLLAAETYDALHDGIVTQELGWMKDVAGSGEMPGFDKAAAATDMLARRGVFRVHPNFRVIASARPPTTEHGKKFWLTPDVTSMFDVHCMTAMPDEDVVSVVASAAIASKGAGILGGSAALTDNEIRSMATRLVALQRRLAEALVATPNLPQLSIRQLLRIATYAVYFPNELASAVKS